MNYTSVHASHNDQHRCDCLIDKRQRSKYLFLNTNLGQLFKIKNVVNDSLKFQMTILQIHLFLVALQRILTFFQQKIKVHLLFKSIYSQQTEGLTTTLS